MKTNRTVGWETPSGKKVTVEISMTRTLTDSSLDGQVVGKETLETLYITVAVDGKHQTRSYCAPEPIDPKFNSQYDSLKAAGVYAALGDAYINEDSYNLIMAAIAEMEAEIAEATTSEFAEVKAQEDARAEARKDARAEAREFASLAKSGICPKCGTWCYGDCEAN